uniref:Large ribosomal subunit protein uL23m n=1 Tax=Chrysotila carterae TaxID=13221 RepID=A0A7S4ET27_CHRCT|mmetsp:Transcript_40661/g.89263  ORF Transcript_40661/g.89263 Transcript_40661/m.89263 type:complete len:146 (+) Transcript_40661:119-556(+)
MVTLFPNWVVKHIRNPQLRTAEWMKRPVEVFHVSPKMTKFEIKEYLIQLYGMPVSKVHTVNFDGRFYMTPEGQRRKHPSYKRAYVYLEDEQGKHRPRYHEAEFQMTEEARQAWPAKPGRTAKDLADKIIDGTLEPSLLRRNWKKY